MTDSIDYGCSGAVTSTDLGCSGAVTSVGCSQEESVSLTGYIFLAGILRKSASMTDAATADGAITLTPTATLSQGYSKDASGTITLTGSLSYQATGTGGGGTKVVIPVLRPV